MCVVRLILILGHSSEYCHFDFLTFQTDIDCFNPFYPEYDSSRSYPFYPEYDSGRSLHLARLPRTLTFWSPIGWLTPNDVSISGSLGNPYFSTNQCRSLGICRPKSAPPSQSEIKDGVESQRSLNVDVFRRITPLIYFILLMTRRQTSG